MFAQTLKEKSSYGMVGIAVVVGLYLLIGAFIVAITVQGRARHEAAKQQQISAVACAPQLTAAC